MWETIWHTAMISFVLIWVVVLCLAAYGSVLNSLNGAAHVRDHADIFSEREIEGMVLIAMQSGVFGRDLVQKWHRKGMFRKKLSWHRTLGIEPDDPLEDVTTAHRNLSKKYHPDSAPDRIGDAKRFLAATKAYKIAKFVAENRPKENFAEKMAH